jgi:hypothetical protein
MKCISFPNMELFTPMALMNIILSKADIDSTFNSYLNLYLFHIYCCICCSVLNICVSIFCNVIYISCLYIVLTKSIWSVNFCQVIDFISLVFKPISFSWPPLVTPDEGPSLETSHFSLYCSGSCIPTNESLLYDYT